MLCMIGVCSLSLLDARDLGVRSLRCSRSGFHLCDYLSAMCSKSLFGCLHQEVPVVRSADRVDRLSSFCVAASPRDTGRRAF